MRFQTNVFSGMRPARSVDLLENGEAQFALNTRLTGGDLDPFYAPGELLTGAVTASASTIAMYRFGKTTSSESLYWFTSTLDCDFVRGPVVNDTEEKTYWTDGVFPKKTNAAMVTYGTTGLPSATYPGALFRMGMPTPDNLSTPTVGGTPTNAADPAETVIYVMTYVSTWGEEGPPTAIPTTAVNIRPGNTVSFSGLPVVPTGTYNSSNCAMAGKRLYRSATGSASTKFQLVNTEGDIPVATTTYVDSKLTKNLGDTLITTDWAPPPDTMRGLCEMANGVLAGFDGNTICFSEPFVPYAWPARYRQSVDAPIVGIMSFEQSLFVGTTQGAYIFTGTDPSQMTSERVHGVQSLASKRSLVRMSTGVVFASPGGLFHISSAGLRSLSEFHLTAKQWSAYNPASFTAFEYDTRYIACFTGGTLTGPNISATQGSIIFTTGENPSFSLSDGYATAGYRDPRTASLYLMISGEIKKWDSAATRMAHTYQSGTYNSPYPVSLAAVRILADEYPVELYYIVDGALADFGGGVFSVPIADGIPRRLPALKGRRFSFAVSSTSRIREVVMASGMRELGNGDTNG